MFLFINISLTLEDLKYWSANFLASNQGWELSFLSSLPSSVDLIFNLIVVMPFLLTSQLQIKAQSPIADFKSI